MWGRWLTCTLGANATELACFWKLLVGHVFPLCIVMLFLWQQMSLKPISFIILVMSLCKPEHEIVIIINTSCCLGSMTAWVTCIRKIMDTVLQTAFFFKRKTLNWDSSIGLICQLWCVWFDYFRGKYCSLKGICSLTFPQGKAVPDHQ